ncbi:MAG: NTP transferase domain-containing protein [Candidatus Marinimicrobia bacterium]|nr:NTP transferase domain-containing protein [Candidatus Neomarinimicrobiota bacterium]
MRAIIPAAGVGKRLRPHTLNVPKVMINLAGKRLIGHVLDAVESAGVDSVSIIVGYKGEQVEEYVNRYYSHLRLDFPYQIERKGLGHAVLEGLEDKEESVLILLGDTVFDVDFKQFVASKSNAIAVVKVDDPRRFGVAEIDANHLITQLVEKPEHPKSDLALAGMYYIQDQRILKAAIEKLIADDIKTRGEYQLTDALQLMIESGEHIEAVEINGWYDCGTKESLLDSHRFLLNHHLSTEHSSGSIIHPPVFIHDEAKVSDCVIGPNVTIDKGAEVSGAILTDTIVGKGAIIKNMILSHSLIGDHAVTEGQKRVVNVGDYSELKLN